MALKIFRSKDLEDPPYVPVVEGRFYVVTSIPIGRSGQVSFYDVSSTKL